MYIPKRRSLKREYFNFQDELDEQEGKKEPKKSENSYFDDLEASLKTAENSDIEKTRKRYTSSFVKLLFNFFCNNGTILARSTNFAHTMASVTV